MTDSGARPSERMWGGRFEKGLLPELEAFNASLEVESSSTRTTSRARWRMRVHWKPPASSTRPRSSTSSALGRGAPGAERRTFVFQPADEDIHTAVERRLTELAPEAGARLHAGRSRNDQVALDLRLDCRAGAAALTGALAGLISALAKQAAVHADWPMPGYTHLQRAQPVTAGHHLLVFCEQLLRDADRAQHAYEAADEMPLGAGALAGSTLNQPREVAARALGFRRLTRNSIDAVSDRDFVLESSLHNGRIPLAGGRRRGALVVRGVRVRPVGGRISTGSSIMPQKKNPDIAELLRGRAGRPVGALVQLATVLKGLPKAYQKDPPGGQGSPFSGRRQRDRLRRGGAADGPAPRLRP